MRIIVLFECPFVMIAVIMVAIIHNAMNNTVLVDIVMPIL